ncbi:MAG: oligosaccharide flippase family protein [Anaerolineae bacterium]|nr:oligosaccharide flippase family protein [Anaerolineae bacterium]
MTTDATPDALTGAEARRAARNAGAIAAARIVSSAALFGWQLILGRALGEAQFGIYNTVGALFAIGVTITAFSMSLIVIRDVARRPESAGRYLSATLVIETVLALAAYVGINAAAQGYDDTIRAFVGIAGLSLFIDMLGTMCYDQLIAQERMVSISVVEVAHILVRITAAGIALWAGYGLLGVYVVTIISGIGRSAALWILLSRTGVRPHFPIDRAIARPLIVNSAPLALAAFINITYQQIDKLLTTGLLTEDDTGHLGAAMVIVYGVVDILSTTVLVAIYPMMSRAYRGDGRDATFRFIGEKLAFFTLLIGLPIGLVFSRFAAEIIVPLFGTNYVETAGILQVLIWYAVVTMVVNVFAQSLMAQNRQRFLVMVRIGGLALKLALSLFLLPRVGVTGAALATAVSELLVLVVLTRDFRPDFVALLPRLARLAGVALVAALAMAALGVINPLLGMAGGALVYASGVLIGRVLAADDWDLLYRLAAAVPGGRVILRYWHRDVKLNW